MAKIRNFKEKKNKSLITKFKEKILCEKDTSSKATFNILEVIIIIFLSILFGIFIGYIVTYRKYSQDKEINEIISTYKNIKNNYYDKLDEKKLADAAIKGMIDSLDDPYSNYMNLETTDSFNESVDGAFVGIGVSLVFSDNYNKVIDVFKDSPAEKSGIKVGDIIIEVNKKDVAGLSSEDFTKFIRGEEGTKVNLVIKRDKTIKNIIVKREKIDLKTVFGEVLVYENNKIGYLNLTTFSANTANQFRKELKDLEKKQISSLIIDVRDNPGGRISQVREILSLFFNKKTVLYQLEAKNSKKKIYSLDNDLKNYPIIILINKKSASASEILASAFLENYKKCLLIGETTYGKGTVQKSKLLSDGTSIKFTTQKWLTSKGKWINKKGIKPDINVELSDDYFNNPNEENDSQLQEALKQIVLLK